MRAAYYEAFGGPENVRIGDRPVPAPDAEHMLVRTRAAAVGIWDVAIMGGFLGEMSLPRIPGSEVAGTVEVAAGGFNLGDRVFCSLWEAGPGGQPDPRGGFAELAAARVDSAARIPDRLDFSEAAALVISASTAYEGLVDRAKLRAGETVLITAASGGVGTTAVQIAKDLGGRVVAVTSARNHDYVRHLGAEVAVDYHDPRFAEQLQRAVPDGFDVLFDGTGNEVRDQVAGLVRDGGRGIFIAGPPPARDGVDFQFFGATVNTPRLEAIAKLASSGRLRMPIEAEYPLERAREAMEHVSARRSVGRVVLRIGS
jgi:NADPH:quinone reductase-like Zn-dependent oxidoreductase